MTDPQVKRVAVAMSGGVDSSVAAGLLCDQGYEVFGVTARLTSEESRCCATEDIETARRVAAQLGFEHHMVDVRESFQSRVIDYFGDAYLAGRTPSPCVVCNRHIKFGALLEAAREMGADAMATGHYARTERGPAGVRLCRGRDPQKDQSYFLARLQPDQLAHSLFPLGACHKPWAVAYAEDRALPCRGSRESQELCFITEGHHGSWLDVRRLDTAGAGPIVDADGTVVGQHHGIHHHTVGQRKGLGVAVGYPVYVVAIDKDRNEVTIGPREDVMASGMVVTDLLLQAGIATPDGVKAAVQIRYNHQAAPAELHLLSDGRADVQFDEPQFAVTPGQLAVFYRDDAVIGSGWIESGVRAIET